MLPVIAPRAIVFGIFLHEVAMMSHLPVAKKHFVEFRDDMNGELAVTENQSRGMLCPFQFTA